MRPWVCGAFLHPPPFFMQLVQEHLIGYCQSVLVNQLAISQPVKLYKLRQFDVTFNWLHSDKWLIKNKPV
jgi:hypothetical protein